MVAEHEIMSLYAGRVGRKIRQMENQRSLRTHEQPAIIAVLFSHLARVIKHAVESDHRFRPLVKSQTGRIVQDRRRITSDRRHRSTHTDIARRSHDRPLGETSVVLRPSTKGQSTKYQG